MSDESGEDGPVDVDAIEDEIDELGDEVGSIPEKLPPIETEIEDVEGTLETAETEDDLDDVEAELAPVAERLGALRDSFDELESTFDEIELPESDVDDEDEGSEIPEPIVNLRVTHEDLEDRIESVDDEIGDLEGAVDGIDSGVEERRGPYAEDVIDEVEAARGDIETTRWTAEGYEELAAAVDDALDAVDDVLDASIDRETSGDGEDDSLEATLLDALEEVAAAVDDAGLDPDDDEGDVAALLEATADLSAGVDDATAWDDLTIREQLRREGFYDVLDHVKDFPPEWHALKVHEKRGNVEMILLALESFDSDFMEEHCLEALERIGPEAAIEPMLQRATRRDEHAIAVLGKIGADDEKVVDKLVDYVDSNPQLQRPSLRALGEIGAETAVPDIADQLVADDPDVRSWAARSLGLIGDARTVEPLGDVLETDVEDRVRASAAWALNRIGTRPALEIVAEYADDRAYLVQAEAKKATIEPAA